MVLANDTVYVHASAKKLEFIRESEKASESLDNGIRIRCLLRERGDVNQPTNRAAIDEIIGAIKESGGSLGHFPTDTLDGPLANGWVDEVFKADIKVRSIQDLVRCRFRCLCCGRGSVFCF